MPITVKNRNFPTQKALWEFLNEIRINGDNAEFHQRVNSAEVAPILEAIITTRPSKVSELGGRKIVAWTRKKNGPHWAFHARLDDGTLLDLGVSKNDISEFVHNWPG